MIRRLALARADDPDHPQAAIFRVVAGTIVIEAMVADRPVIAMIDTGIPRSVVSPSVARELRLDRLRAAAFQSEHGPVAADIVGPVCLALGGRRWRLPAVITAHAPFLAQTAIGVDLLIGQDVLRTAAFAIDFSRGCLRVLTGAAVQERDGFVRVPVVTDQEGRIALDVDLPGIGHVPAILDLGSNTALMVDAGFFRHLDLASGAATSTGLIATLGGRSVTTAFSLPSLTIAGLPARDIPADALHPWSSPQPLNLGLELVRQFDLVLDLPRDAIWLRPIAAAAFDRESSGALVAYCQTHLEVVHVARNSPAQAAGLRRGAHIVAIDDCLVDAAYFTGGLWRWRYGPPGRAVQLALPDRVLTLRLDRYY